MDDPELTLDQGLFRSHKISEGKLNTKEQKHNGEVNEEKNSEISSHQESGDTGPAVEQETSERSSPGKDMSDPTMKTDRGVTSLRPKELMDHTPPAAISGSVKKSSTSLRKTSHRCSQRLTGQEPLLSSPQATGLPPQMASPIALMNEMDTKEEGTWINQKTGLEMRCSSQQTSGIWDFKSLSALLRPSIPESQVNKNTKQGERSALEERKTVCPSGETMTMKAQPPIQESIHGEKRGLQSEVQPDHQPPQLLQGQPEGQNTWWNPCEHLGGEALPGALKSPLLQPLPELKVDQTWLSPKNSQELKCKVQIVSLVQDLPENACGARPESQEKRDDKLLWPLRNIGSKTNRQMTLSYTEGEENVQQTYSVISLEEGIMLNRRTRNILVNCSQQTSDTLLLRPCGAAQENHRETFKGVSGLRSNSFSADSEHPSQREMEAERLRTPSQQSYNESQESGYGSLSTQDKDWECDSTERFPSNQHLSEEALFRIESCLSLMATEEDLLSIYEGSAEKEGSFINRMTGKLLESQCIQTEESFLQRPGRCKGILMP